MNKLRSGLGFEEDPRLREPALAARVRSLLIESDSETQGTRHFKNITEQGNRTRQKQEEISPNHI